MKTYFLFFIAFLTAIQSHQGQQISTTPSTDPNTLINSNFFENCVLASNINVDHDGSSQNISSYGTFQNNGSNFPFESGIIISSGNIIASANTANTIPLNAGNISWIGSPNIETALGITNTFNATEITFEFTTLSDKIAFNYMIASEEYYLENPCSFSDAYAILIKPTGSGLPFTNMAVVPNTLIAASSNTIHNEIVGFCDAENEAYFEGYNLGNTNFNGHTKVLQATANVSVNTSYTIKFIVADVADSKLDSALFIEASAPSAFIDLGADINLCDDNTLLDGDLGNPEASYQWFLDGTVLPGATNTMHLATTSGNYRLVATLPICTIEDEITVTLNDEINFTAPSNLISCYNFNGTTTLDLTPKALEITGSETNLDISFHFTENEALTGDNPIPNNLYTNAITNTTIYVGITNLVSGCKTTASFTVMLNEVPILNTNTVILNACDSDLDGFSPFDLNTSITEFITDTTNLNISFFETQADAVSNTNPIPNSSNYTNTTINSQTVYIRVENTNTSCINIGTLNLFSNYALSNLRTEPYTICDYENDGIESYILDDITAELTEDFIITTTLTYYLTEADRDNQTNALNINDVQYINSTEITLYAIVDTQGCLSNYDITFSLEPTFEFTAIGMVDICSNNTSTTSLVNLQQTFTSLVINNTAGYSVNYYLTAADAELDLNAIPNNFTNTTNPQLLYTKITDNATGCSTFNSFSYNVLPAPSFNMFDAIIICDDNLDGIYAVDLQSRIPELVPSLTDRLLSFHPTAIDATNNANTITNLTNFVTASTTIYIRVLNTLTGCYNTAPYPIIINVQPQINTLEPFYYCEDNTDGFGEFILSDKDTEVVDDITDLTISYFENEADAMNSSNPIDKNSLYFNTSSPQTVYVRAEHLTDPTCFSVSNFELIAASNPLFNTPTSLFLCDDILNDGFETFDLSDTVTEMGLGMTDVNLAFSFYTSYEDAEANNNMLPLNYTNTTNPQEIFVRVDNGGVCHPIVSFSLEVYLVADINPIESLSVCDDDYDGFSTIDLTTTEDFIFDVRLLNIEVSYFETEIDVIDQTNVITSPENYSNISNPQTIYVRVTNSISGCYFYFPLDLIVNLPPVINDFEFYEICENETNAYDLTLINTIVSSTSTNTSYAYYTSLEDATLQTNALASLYATLTPNDTLFVDVTNTITGCNIIYPFELIVNPLPSVPLVQDFEVCDSDNNGIEAIDLNTQNALILQNLNPTQFTVSYYTSLADAEAHLEAITSTYNALHNEVIYVRLENNTTGCYDITNFNIILLEYPELNLDAIIPLCEDDIPLIINATQTSENFTFLWSTNATSNEIAITTPGDYWVKVTSAAGCILEHYFQVISSSAATITNVTVTNFSDPNSISITVEGSGDYSFALDNGELQSSSTFNNVALGLHTVYVFDSKGCSTVSIEVFVIGVPKFFTPNSDTKNDLWQVIGTAKLDALELSVFDRYGKLIIQLNKNTIGWDGACNGSKLPASDYWYSGFAIYEGKTIKLKGHFSLVR